jgi:hypothetical protein
MHQPLPENGHPINIFIHEGIYILDLEKPCWHMDPQHASKGGRGYGNKRFSNILQTENMFRIKHVGTPLDNLMKIIDFINVSSFS